MTDAKLIPQIQIPRMVTVKGPRGSLVKSFKHLAIDVYMVDKETIKVMSSIIADSSVDYMMILNLSWVDKYMRQKLRLRNGLGKRSRLQQ